MGTLHEHIELLIGIDDNAYKCFISISIANYAIYMKACGTDFNNHNSWGKTLFNSMPSLWFTIRKF